MAKRKQTVIEFPFYQYLNLFYRQNKKRIFSSYKDLTKKFLRFNDPDENPIAFLRRPQFEALEIYVFLKEFLHNQFLHQIFENWYKKEQEFKDRDDIGITKEGQYELFNPLETEKKQEKQFIQEVFAQIGQVQTLYPNYIFALTMGLGKTVLMATSIFYEFLLANKHPRTPHYCHNALVFAPDKTVLHSLKEIITFDKSKVVPPEYVNWLETHLNFYFLDDTGDALNAIDKSKYNIIISNTQKIILKKQHKAINASQAIFGDYDALYKAKSLNEDFNDLYAWDEDIEDSLITNQRFEKLIRLKQLGVYVDEAHHVFGTTLAKDFGLKEPSSLRLTINELAENLKAAGTQVVACYNYTGTPYAGKHLLPDVVYTYTLKDAIDNRYLKQVKINGFANVQSQSRAFVKTAIDEFWQEHDGKKYENLTPKIAFFAATIDELQNELRPTVEAVLAEKGIPLSKILVNVGDSSITTNDDIREFKNLDSPQSDKQFILLVNKGKEGWNCRSLFAVALHRKPKSKVFVLQATMRCLRSITDAQRSAMVFLSEENIKILESELQDNFKLTIDELNRSGDNSETVEVRLVPPPIKIKLGRVRKLHQLKEKQPPTCFDFEFDKIEFEKYKVIRTERDIRDISKKTAPDKDFSHVKEKREYSELALIGEIAQYLNASCLKIRKLLVDSKQGVSEILKTINNYNEVLHDWLIPTIFKQLFEIEEFEKVDEIEIDLVKPPKNGDCYQLKAKKDLIVNMDDLKIEPYKFKSFHLDNYCFDSIPENDFFLTVLKDEKVEKIWFTGMLTHGQSDFVIYYIDPETHTLRSYYPDFLALMKDGSYLIFEIKADHMIDDKIVLAKAHYAKQIAGSSGMSYYLIRGTKASQGIQIHQSIDNQLQTCLV